MKLTDISFLNIAEYEDLRVEESFFTENPELGQFFNWPIVGSSISPNWLSEVERIKEVSALNNSIDNLPSKIPQLYNLIHPSEAPATPQVVMIHCEAGSDRTGQVAGSYAMAYQKLGKNTTLAEVYAVDNEIAGRPIVAYSLYGMMFFCWWLTQIQGFTNLGCDQTPTAVPFAIL